MCLKTHIEPMRVGAYGSGNMRGIEKEGRDNKVKLENGQARNL